MYGYAHAMHTETALPSSDETLARRAQEGNREAFSVLVERYQRGIINLAYRLVGGWDIALDLAQDTFVRAYVSLHTYNSKRRFSPWLYRIATNRCYDYLRHQGHWILVSWEEDITEMSWLPDKVGDPVRQLERQDVCHAIEEAIAGLPPRYRTVIVLRYLEGMSYQEIADTLELPMGTVKTQIYRARDLLRQALSSWKRIAR